MENKLKGKFPWGILAGICAVIVFYTIVGTVAAYLVLSVIGGATTEGAGLFDTWYQVLLFVGDIVFGAGFVLFTALYIARRAGSKREEKESRS